MTSEELYHVTLMICYCVALSVYAFLFLKMSSMSLLSEQMLFFFFFSSRRRHTRFDCDWSSDVCSSDLLQRSIFENTRAFMGLKTRGVVYDVTNTYFHGKRCLLGRLGHDKENRKGYPLIQIGLAVTAEEGIPIFHKTFPGHIHDSRTFVDISNDLMHLGITCGIAVIDRGISSAENTAFLRQKRWHVLCGLKRSPAIEAALGADFSSAELCQLDHRVHVQQTVFYVRAQPFRQGKSRGRLFVCFNQKAALDQREEIGRAHV